jgi:hypothetical protein
MIKNTLKMALKFNREPPLINVILEKNNNMCHSGLFTHKNTKIWDSFETVKQDYSLRQCKLR